MNKKLDKYVITKEDLDLRYHTTGFVSLTNKFLAFIEEEKKKGNYILSDANINRLERKVKKGIYIDITILTILGVFCLILGLYQFIYTRPLIGVNLYTHFPLISNGAIEIAGSVALFIGCVFSFARRNSVTERLVKSKLIEALEKLQKEKDLKINYNSTSKKRKRFRKPYKVGKKSK